MVCGTIALNDENGDILKMRYYFPVTQHPILPRRFSRTLNLLLNFEITFFQKVRKKIRD